MCNFLTCNRYLNRMSRHKVGTANNIGLWSILEIRNSCTCINFNKFGSNFAHFNIMLLSHILLYLGCENIACNTDTLLADYTAERDNGNLSCTSSYIYHHVSAWSFNIEPDSESCCHRLVNNVHVSSAGMFRGVTYGSYFNLCIKKRKRLLRVNL